MAVTEAVSLLRRDNPGIYLIEGPPGTGKSTVILRIIQEVLSNSVESRKPYLLLVAPSNAAVDEIATRFLNWRSTLSST